MATERVASRNEWLDQHAEHDDFDPTKITISPKAKGQLADGYSKLDAGKDATGKPLQLKSERERVGSKWPGPKGRVGTVLHGKASPSSAESFLHVAKNKEFQAK